MQRYLILLICPILMLVSCRSVGEFVYISNVERDNAQQIVSNYNSLIHLGDLLNIQVSSQTPEAVLPFNQSEHYLSADLTRLRSRIGGNVDRSTGVVVPHRFKEYYGYLVDDLGRINFPILGILHVAGISIDSLQNLLSSRLRSGGYVNDAVVTVSIANFRISVVGEVRVPQELHIRGSRLTIFEALAMCGDITINGLRDNVTVVREKEGVAVPITIDLTQKTVFDSPVYYLQSNDIVYVEPNDKIRRKATLNRRWPQYIDLSSSVVGAVWKITRVVRRSNPQNH